jgi:3-oxoacyl-[acyl-carrier protein] reductase
VKHKDQVIIITGASKGIGFSIAESLAKEGAKVVICGRNIEMLRVSEKKLIEAGYDALGVQADVSKEEDTLKLAKETMDKFGKIDVLVNNAGIFPVKLFSDMTLADWQKVIGIDLNGTFLATKAVYDVMKKQKSGLIVNIASVAGRIGGYGFTHYSAAKGGVLAFTKALAREAAGLNIRVNAVCPGIIETDTAKVNFPSFSLKEQTRLTPMGRLGEEEDLIGVVSFLASDDSKFMTGQVIAVDGGYTMIG